MAKAITIFRDNIKRCEIIFGLSVALEENFIDNPFIPDASKTISAINEELARSVVVNSVSAMDRYFTDKFVDCMTPYLKGTARPKELIGLFKQAGFDVKYALSLLNNNRNSNPMRKVRTA